MKLFEYLLYCFHSTLDKIYFELRHFPSLIDVLSVNPLKRYDFFVHAPIHFSPDHRPHRRKAGLMKQKKRTPNPQFGAGRRRRERRTRANELSAIRLSKLGVL